MKIIIKTAIKFLPLMIAASFVSSSVVAGDSATGKVIYDGKGACGSCHGLAGAADGVAAVALTPKPTNFITANYHIDTDGDGQIGSDADIANVIKLGAAKYMGSVSMPARPDLSDAEVGNLVAYLKSLKK